MKLVIKSILDIIKRAEDVYDDFKFFNLFKDLLSNVYDGSDIDCSEAGELNLLQEVANRGMAKYVKYLLDTFPGIDPNSAGKGTPPAIFLAINNSHLDVLQVLIDHRQEQCGFIKNMSVAFDAIDTYTGRNIFHSLPFHKNDERSIQTAETIFSITNSEIRSELLKVINIRDCDGYTALDYALVSSTQDYMKMLVEFGASLAHYGENDVITKIPPEIIENVLNKNCLKMVALEKSMKDSKVYQQLEDGVCISANFDFLRPTGVQMGGETLRKYLRKMNMR